MTPELLLLQAQLDLSIVENDVIMDACLQLDITRTVFWFYYEAGKKSYFIVQ